MKQFFDTSVLVAAFFSFHIHHNPSLKRFASAEKSTSACGIHSLAEVYSAMTRLPVRPPIPPEQALLFLDEIRTRLTIVTLTPEEYFKTIQSAAAKGYTGGRVYDALLLACADKFQSQAIYTWNLKQFQALSPKLADKIQNP